MVRERLTLFIESFQARLAPVQFNATATILLVLLLSYVIAASFYEASRRLFWYDEICTLAIVHQSTIYEMWNALRAAADSAPPLFYIVERYAASLLTNEHVGYRLASILGFACVPLSLFAYCRPRTGALGALIAAVVPLLTILYHEYSVEARPYALVMGCLSFSLICWQRAIRFRWAVLFSLTLAAAVSLHYYAVLALLPFAIGELVYALRHRRLRLGVWVGLFSGVVPLVAFWPLLMSFKNYYGYGGYSWAQPTLRNLVSTYSGLFGIVLAIMFLTAMLALAFRRSKSSESIAIPLEECVLALGFLGLPFLLLVVAWVGNGPVIPRYVLPAILGLALTAGYVSSWVGRKTAGLFLMLLLSALAAREAQFWILQLKTTDAIALPSVHVERLLHATAMNGLPVVISSGHQYVPIAYYSLPQSSHRFVALVDPAKSLQYAGSDIVDRSLLKLRSYLPLQVYEYSEFASLHPTFLLYSTSDSWNWWPKRLVHDGHFLQLLAIGGDRALYLVKLKESNL